MIFVFTLIYLLFKYEYLSLLKLIQTQVKKSKNPQDLKCHLQYPISRGMDFILAYNFVSKEHLYPAFSWFISFRCQLYFIKSISSTISSTMRSTIILCITKREKNLIIRWMPISGSENVGEKCILELMRDSSDFFYGLWGSSLFTQGSSLFHSPSKLVPQCFV